MTDRPCHHCGRGFPKPDPSALLDRTGKPYVCRHCHKADDPGRGNRGRLWFTPRGTLHIACQTRAEAMKRARVKSRLLRQINKIRGGRILAKA